MLKKTNFLTVLAQAVEDEHVGIPIRDIYDDVDDDARRDGDGEWDEGTVLPVEPLAETEMKPLRAHAKRIGIFEILRECLLW